MTWGRDTDQHEARDQLEAFADAGGTLVDTAAAYGNGESRAGPRRSARRGRAARETWSSRPRLASPGDRGRRARRRVTRALLDQLDASLDRLDTDYVDLWQIHAWSDAVPPWRRRWQRWTTPSRPAGPATPASPTTAAGRPAAPWPTSQRRRPGAAGVHPGGVLAAAARRRARGAAGRGSARHRRAGVVAAGTWRADRQVPQRHTGRLARRLPAFRRLRRDVPRRSVRDASSRPSRPRRRVSASNPWRSRWHGFATARCVAAALVGARTAASCAAFSPVRISACPTRSGSRWTRFRRRRWDTPNAPTDRQATRSGVDHGGMAGPGPLGSHLIMINSAWSAACWSTAYGVVPAPQCRGTMADGGFHAPCAANLGVRVPRPPAAARNVSRRRPADAHRACRVRALGTRDAAYVS